MYVRGGGVCRCSVNLTPRLFFFSCVVYCGISWISPSLKKYICTWEWKATVMWTHFHKGLGERMEILSLHSNVESFCALLRWVGWVSPCQIPRAGSAPRLPIILSPLEGGEMGVGKLAPALMPLKEERGSISWCLWQRNGPSPSLSLSAF